MKMNKKSYFSSNFGEKYHFGQVSGSGDTPETRVAHVMSKSLNLSMHSLCCTVHQSELETLTWGEDFGELTR